MAAIADFAHKFGLVLKACNLSRGRLAHFLLGSTADSVIRKASCPVVSVRADVPTPARKAAIAFA